jgi:hypothetical protein
MKELYRDTGWLTGTHQGANGAALFDPNMEFEVSDCVGRLIINDTDSSEGLVTANTKNTLTVTLAGGTNNNWQNGDEYTIYIGATANAVLSTTIVCKKSGFAAPVTGLVDGELPDWTDDPQDKMDIKG